MTTAQWKHPVFGIVTYRPETYQFHGVGAQMDHAYGILFDAADAPPSHVRLIDYAGSSTPPSAAPTSETTAVDSGILFAISPRAAQHIVDTVDTLETELKASPHPRRYYFAERVVALPPHIRDREQRPATRAEKVGAVLAGRASKPTNCVHFLMQTLRQSGVDLDAIDPTLAQTDDVDEVTRIIERRMKSSTQREGLPLRGTLDAGQPIVTFSFSKNQSLLPLLGELPTEAFAAWREAAPLTRAGAILSRPGMEYPMPGAGSHGIR